jgi:hypothetical protein
VPRPGNQNLFVVLTDTVTGLINNSPIFIPKCSARLSGHKSTSPYRLKVIQESLGQILHHPTVPKSFKIFPNKSYVTFVSFLIPNLRFSFLAVVAALTAIMSVSATPVLFEGRSCVSSTDCVGSACCIESCVST